MKNELIIFVSFILLFLLSFSLFSQLQAYVNLRNCTFSLGGNSYNTLFLEITNNESKAVSFPDSEFKIYLNYRDKRIEIGHSQINKKIIPPKSGESIPIIITLERSFKNQILAILWDYINGKIKDYSIEIIGKSKTKLLIFEIEIPFQIHKQSDGKTELMIELPYQNYSTILN